MPPTERLDIYERLLAFLKSHDIYWGLCYSLRNIGGDYEITDLPELMKYEPADKDPRNNWWPWSKRGKAKRIAAVEQAIEEVKILCNKWPEDASDFTQPLDKPINL